MSGVSYIQNICDKYSEYISNEKYVYKSCKYPWIVILEKLDDTLNNEARNGIIDISYAKCRASKLKVVLIFDKLFPHKTIDSVTNSFFSVSTNYVVGEIIYADSFDENIDNVCSHGIHYFKTIDCAFFYGNHCIPLDFTGDNLQASNWNDMTGFANKPLTFYFNGQKDTSGLAKYILEKYSGEARIRNTLFTMVNGILHGKSIKYGDCDNPQIVCNYLDGRLDGSYVEYHVNGNEKIDCNYSGGKETGLHVEKYENGNPKKICNYLDGTLNGSYVNFYSNGVEKVNCNYSYGKGTGLYVEKYENGNNQMVSNYLGGTLNGSRVDFYENGNEKIICNYLDGKLCGWYVEKYENGNDKLKCEYKKNIFHGEYFSYYETGKLEANCEHSNGKLVNKYIKYNAMGECIEKYEIMDDEKVTFNREMYDNGASKSFTIFDTKGRIHKLHNEYYENGNVSVECKYRHGKKLTHTEWNEDHTKSKTWDIV